MRGSLEQSSLNLLSDAEASSPEIKPKTFRMGVGYRNLFRLFYKANFDRLEKISHPFKLPEGPGLRIPAVDLKIGL